MQIICYNYTNMSYESNENLNFAHIPQVDALVVPPVGIEGEAEPLLPSSPLSANPTQLPGWDGAKLDAMRPFIVRGNPIKYEGLIGDVAKAGDPTTYDAMLRKQLGVRKSMVSIAEGRIDFKRRQVEEALERGADPPQFDFEGEQQRLETAQLSLANVEDEVWAKFNEDVLEKTAAYQDYVRSATEAAAAVYDANPALGSNAETLAGNVADFRQIFDRQVGAAALLVRLDTLETQARFDEGQMADRYQDRPEHPFGIVMDMIMPSRKAEREQGVRRGYPTLGQYALKNTPEVISLIELCEATESNLARSGNQPATAELDAIRGLAQCVLEAFTADAEAFTQRLAQQVV